MSGMGDFMGTDNKRAQFPVLAVFILLLIGASVSIISFVLALVFFICFVMGDKEQFQNTILKYEGLWERPALFCMYAPFIQKSVGNLLFRNDIFIRS